MNQVSCPMYKNTLIYVIMKKDIVFFPILKQFSSMSLQQKSASDINRGTTGKNNAFLAKKLGYFTYP